MKEQIIICMPLKNAADTVAKSIQSVLNQKAVKRELILLIGNDHSSDSSLQIIQSFLPNTSIQLLNVEFGKVHLNRNFLNKYARLNFPNCALIGRLDSDDVLYDDDTISKIEEIYDQTNFDVLMCGNQQIKNGEILEWENKATKKLLDNEYLSKRLLGMIQGHPRAELPSCNTFIKPDVMVEYPNVKSAEDHWFTVLLLLQKERYDIHIGDSLVYCVYSLDGVMTDENRKKEAYQQSRNELYNFFKNTITS